MALVLTCRVDAKARICVRQSYYSVPARYAGRRLEVRLGATTVTVLDGATVIAEHARSLHKYSEDLVLDHYLEVLTRKPGALPGATALAAARACGGFTVDHQRFWDAARRRLGDGPGTRALVGVLLLHRTLTLDAVTGRAGRRGRAGHRSTRTWSRSRPAAPPTPTAPPLIMPIGRRGGSAGAVTGWLRPAAERNGVMTAAMSRLAEPAAEAAILAACKTLQLPTIRAQAGQLAAAAAKQRLSHKAFLAEVLTAECDERDARRRIRLVHEAKFPRTKRLTDFDPVRIGLDPGSARRPRRRELDRPW